MNDSQTGYELIEITGDYRWLIYLRLQVLGISCFCASHQPLKVEVSSAAIALQVWSVIRQNTLPRQEQVTWLDRCWNFPLAKA